MCSQLIDKCDSYLSISSWLLLLQDNPRPAVPLRRNEVEVPIETPIGTYDDLQSVEELLKEREHFEKYVSPLCNFISARDNLELIHAMIFD